MLIFEWISIKWDNSLNNRLIKGIIYWRRRSFVFFLLYLALFSFRRSQSLIEEDWVKALLLFIVFFSKLREKCFIQSFAFSKYFKAKGKVNLGLFIWALLKKLYALWNLPCFFCEYRKSDGSWCNFSAHWNHENIDWYLFFLILKPCGMILNLTLRFKSLPHEAFATFEFEKFPWIKRGVYAIEGEYRAWFELLESMET